MYFPFIFCIIVAFFVSGGCKNLPRSEKNTDFNTYETVRKCKQHAAGVKNTVNNSKCKPIYTHVPLTPMMASDEFYPSVAYVKRCSGHCSALKSCMPLKSKMIKVPAKLRSNVYDTNSSPRDICVLVDVEEHTECDCTFRQNEKDCTPKQYYDRDHRLCVCNNQKDGKNECEGKEMTWDSVNCSCN